MRSDGLIFFNTWFGNSDFRVKSKPYLCYIILLQVPPPICEDYLNAFSWSSSTIMIVETDLNPYKSCILGSRNFRIKYFKKIETIWPQFIQSSARKSFDTLDIVLCCLFSGFFRRFAATITNSSWRNLDFFEFLSFSFKLGKNNLQFLSLKSLNLFKKWRLFPIFPEFHWF